jgi:hypothetical protein
MTDFAPRATRLPVPGPSIWWLVGACAVGIALSAIIGAVTALAAYYPIGSVLPRTFILRPVGTIILTGFVGISVVVAGIAYSVLARRWRPFFLSFIASSVTVSSFYLAMYSHGYLRVHAFHLLEARSAVLVNAIQKYEQDLGHPPQALADLVPSYLTEIPRTGMSSYPEYDFARGPGYCRQDSAWNISILAGDLLNWDTFFYCPRGDYPPDVGGNRVAPIGSWAYMYE